MKDVTKLKWRKVIAGLGLAGSLSLLSGCGVLDNLVDSLNLFSVSDDLAMGQEVAQEIAQSPEDYPILDESDYADAYEYLYDMRDEILDNASVANESSLAWEIYIIDDDDTLNAFAVPGGYLYFYTGLLRYLDEEDHLAGVMGHEMAHAAERHSTDAMTRQFGTDLLLDLILGNNQNVATDIVGDLTNLGFNRDNESDADSRSVEYLSDTRYACNGAAGFFEKLEDEGSDNGPEFFSTHPSPDNRVAAINEKADDENCDTTLSGRNYQTFLNMLP